MFDSLRFFCESIGPRARQIPLLLLALMLTLPSCKGPGTQPTTQGSLDATATLREPIKIAMGKVRPPLEHRIVSFHKGKADKRLIRLASQLGFNGVQIQIEGSTVEGIKQFAKYDAKEHLVEYCHSLGMAVTLWVHELSDVPLPWMPEWLGEVTVENQALWNVLDTRYEWMLGQAVPNVDGLVLTVVETGIRATDTPVMVKLAALLDAKCKKYGKELTVRTFVWYPDEFKAVLAAIDEMPKNQLIMSKCVPQDWNIRGMDAPEIGDVGGRPQVEEFDIAGEYFLRSIVANCMVNQLKRQFDHGISKNISGICVRVDRDDDSVLHEPNEVNLWTLGMLAAGATDNVDEIWNAWATNRFGADAAPGVIKALKPAEDVVSELLSVGSLDFGDTRQFPPLGDEDIFGQLHQNWWWSDAYKADHEKAEVGEPGFTDKVAADKARAEDLARTCLMNLELVKDRLKPEDFAILRTRLMTNKVQNETRAAMALADLHYRQLINAKTDEAKATADAAMRADLTRLRTVALPIYWPQTELEYLGRKWKVGQPENVWRDTIYSWAWKMDLLRQGKDPRPRSYGHGLLRDARRPATRPIGF